MKTGFQSDHVITKKPPLFFTSCGAVSFLCLHVLESLYDYCYELYFLWHRSDNFVDFVKVKPLLLVRWIDDCALKMNCRSQFFVLFWIFGRCVCNVVKLSPSCVDGVCEFDWVVDYKFTMMWYNKTSEAGPQYQPIGLGDDRLIRRRSTTPNCTGTINGVTLTG